MMFEKINVFNRFIKIWNLTKKERGGGRKEESKEEESKQL